MVRPASVETAESNLGDRLTATAVIPGVSQLEADSLRAAQLAAPLTGTVVTDPGTAPADPGTTNAPTGTQPQPTLTTPGTPPPSSAAPGPDPMVELTKELNKFSEAQTWWYEEGSRYTNPADYDRALRYFCRRQGKMIQVMRHVLQAKGVV